MTSHGSRLPADRATFVDLARRAAVSALLPPEKQCANVEELMRQRVVSCWTRSRSPEAAKRVTEEAASAPVAECGDDEIDSTVCITKQHGASCLLSIRHDFFFLRITIPDDN